MVGFVQAIPGVSGESYSLTGLKATCFYGVKGDSSAAAEVATVEPKVVATPAATKEVKPKQAA